MLATISITDRYPISISFLFSARLTFILIATGKSKSWWKKRKIRRRLDSDFVHLDRRRRKRQVFVAEQLQSRPPSAAVMHASSKSSSLEEARLVARGIHPQLDATWNTCPSRIHGFRWLLSHPLLISFFFSLLFFFFLLVLPILYSGISPLPLSLRVSGLLSFFPCHASLSFASSYQVIDHRSPFFAATTVGKHEASRKRKNILDTCYRWKSLNPNKRTCISRYNSMLPSSRSFEIKSLIFLRIIDDLYFWLYHRMKEPHRLKLDDKIQLINIIV